MATYVELHKQIEELRLQAESLKEAERVGVIERVKEAIALYGITAMDLGLVKTRGVRAASGLTAKRAGKKTAKKTSRKGIAYADTNGNTWGGRGKRPGWLREALASGAKLEDFATRK